MILDSGLLFLGHPVGYVNIKYHTEWPKKVSRYQIIKKSY